MQPVQTSSFRIGRLTAGGVADIKKSSHDGLCKDVRTGYIINLDVLAELSDAREKKIEALHVVVVERVRY
jgi:hypothetical protein